MEISNEDLAEISRMGAAAYTPKQVCFAMGFKREIFFTEFNNEDSDLCASYYKGFFSSELVIRESVFQLARNGSSPAQTLALKNFDDTRKTIKKDGFTSEEI